MKDNDHFDVARVVFKKDSCWLVATRPQDAKGPIIPIGLFPTEEMAYAFQGFLQEDAGDDATLTGMDIDVVKFSRT